MDESTKYYMEQKGPDTHKKVHAVCEVKQQSTAICAERSEWVACVESRLGGLSVTGHKGNS